MILFLPLAPDDGSSASDCLSNFATVDTIVAGLEGNIRGRQGEQHLIPRINFTCHRFITKWIIGAECDNSVRHDFYPELQTWNSTDGTTYTKQGATTFSVDGEMTFY